MPVAPAMRDLIDEALNTVIEQAAADAGLSMGTLGRCADYALVGARVLSLLLGHPYVARSGGEVIDCGSGHYVVLHPGRDARRRAQRLSELKDYHCWIEALHPQPDGSMRREMIDFTTRHDPLVAAMFKLPYTRAHTPRYLWDWHANIVAVPPAARGRLPPGGRSGDWMWPDPDCQRLLDLYAADFKELLGTLSCKVLERLIARLEGGEVT